MENDGDMVRDDGKEDEKEEAPAKSIAATAAWTHAMFPSRITLERWGGSKMDRWHFYPPWTASEK